MTKFDPPSGPTASPSDPGSPDPRGLFSEALGVLVPTVAAVFVDAAFFLRRMRALGHLRSEATGAEAAKVLHQYALRHLRDRNQRPLARLYRIFVYDAPPYGEKGHLPISGEFINYAKTPPAQYRRDFHQALRGLRKVALRLGDIGLGTPKWSLRPQALRELFAKRTLPPLDDSLFQLNLRQKGVDTRLAIDLVVLACKRLINQAILITGDADFVPAAKVARREGVDVVLDPLWLKISRSLFEHIDGLQTRIARTRRDDPAPALEEKPLD